MNIASYAKANQLVPISKARATLSSLVEEVKEKDFFVLVKKYQPKAILVDLKFFDKLLAAYQRWIRKQDFASLDQIRESIPSLESAEIEKDIKNAIKAVRNAG